MRQFRPIITSQQFRAGQAIRNALSTQAGIPNKELLTLYSVRLAQTGVVEHNELPNVKADFVFYVGAANGKISPEPLLIVFLDQEEAELSKAIELLEAKGLPVSFCTSIQALADPEAVINLRSSQFPPGDPGKPFNWSETKYLLGLLAAVHAQELSNSLLLTGQTALSAFTNFRGYSHDQSKSDTDADFLICTPPPICFPLMAIEIDGPHHFSFNALNEKLDDAEKARQRLNREKRKSKEKDSAYEEAEIAALHVRVDSKTPSVRDNNMVALCSAVLHCAQQILASPELIEKKAKWIASISNGLHSKIFNTEAGKRFFSKIPELEDAFFTLSEICEAFKDQRDLYKQMLPAQIDTLLGKKTLERSGTEHAVIGIYKNLEVMEALHNHSWDGAISNLSLVRGNHESTDNGATIQQEIILNLRLGSGRPCSVGRLSERVPFITFSGKFPGDFREVFIDYMISSMKQNMLRRISIDERKRMLAEMKEMIEIDTYMLQQRIAETEISMILSSKGSQGLISDLECRAAGSIRSFLQVSGVIGLAEKLHNSDESSHAWNWADSHKPCPDWWNDNGQKLDSLDDAIAAAREAKPEIRNKLVSEINAWGVRRLEFLEASGASFELVDKFSDTLRSIESRIVS